LTTAGIYFDHGWHLPITVNRPEEGDALPGNNYNPAIAPDRSKVVFVSDATGQAQLYIMHLYAVNPVQLTFDNCAHEAPNWSVVGDGLLWMANCDGDWEIYSGKLAFGADHVSHWPLSAPYTYHLAASLVDVRKLTDNGADDMFPRYVPGGKTIAFNSNRDGQHEIYLMSPEGRSSIRLTSSAGDDMNPSWSQDGARLAFDSNRDGDWEVFSMLAADGSQQTQLTDNAVDDRWSIWYQ
jgi:Tol biopolymer transport system component